MWKQISDWFMAILVAAAFAVSVFGAAEWFAQKSGAAVPATADAFTIVVDAGYGGSDGGAVGIDTGVVEAGLNLTVAKLVEKRLTGEGVRVVMTRTDENALASDKHADLAARGKLFQAPDVDLVVSIHMNKFTDRSVHGAMAYYMLGSAEGQKLAQCVIDALCTATDRPRRLANPGDYYVVRECACPAVLVECGFLSNAEEERKLQDADYQLVLADAIADGILAYQANHS